MRVSGNTLFQIVWNVYHSLYCTVFNMPYFYIHFLLLYCFTALLIQANMMCACISFHLPTQNCACSWNLTSKMKRPTKWSAASIQICTDFLKPQRPLLIYIVFPKMCFWVMQGTPLTNSGYVQYIPRNMHTVFALLCFVVVIHWLIFPYPSGLLHWHCGNLTIAPVPAKQPWWIWINTSCEFIINDCITTTKQSTTKPCAYFLGYTVARPSVGLGLA